MPRLCGDTWTIGADRQKIAVELIDQRRHGNAERQTDRYADGAHQQDLNEEDADDLRARGADAAQRGDDLHALVDECRDGVCDADAADEQRSESDEDRGTASAARATRVICGEGS